MSSYIVFESEQLCLPHTGVFVTLGVADATQRQNYCAKGDLILVVVYTDFEDVRPAPAERLRGQGV